MGEAARAAKLMAEQYGGLQGEGGGGEAEGGATTWWVCCAL